MADLKDIAIALLSSTSITIGDNSNGTKIDLYIVPDAKICIITDVILHTPSGTLAGCNDVDFGTGPAAATQAFLNNVTNIEDMTSALDYMRLVATGNDYKFINGAEADPDDRTFGIYVVTGATTDAATVTIDVFGYLYDIGSGM